MLNRRWPVPKLLSGKLTPSAALRQYVPGAPMAGALSQVRLPVSPFMKGLTFET
jgi:hypothetical protein